MIPIAGNWLPDRGAWLHNAETGIYYGYMEAKSTIHHLRIHDWTTFAVFIFLGFFQLVVAFDSGWVAVDALPQEKKRTHKIVFAISAIALLILTVAIGLLNDNSQYKATEDVVAIQDKLDEGKARLIEANGRLDHVQNALDKGQTTPAQHGDIEREISDIRKNISQAIAAFGSPVRQTAATSRGGVSPSIAPAPQIELPLGQRMRALAADLQQDDVGTAIAFSDEVGHYYKHLQTMGKDVSNIPITPEVLAGLVKNDSTRAQRYRDKWLPQIQALRHEAQTQLHMSPREVSDDDKQFDALSKAASAPTPVPSDLSQTAFGKLKFDSVCKYLLNLAEKVPAAVL